MFASKTLKFPLLGRLVLGSESLFSRRTPPVLLSPSPALCPSTISPLLLRNGRRGCSRSQFLRIDSNVDYGWCSVSSGSLSTRRCGAIEGVDVEVPSPRPLPVFELKKRHHSMERPASSSEAVREPSTELGRRFWEGSQREAYCALYHPFVVALARGTLRISAFERYIAQDTYFLAAFSEAYGLAIENADDPAAKAVLQGLKRGVQDELDQVHSSVGTAEPLAAIEPNPATLAYTEFLLGVARGDGHRAGEDERAALRRRRIAACTIASMTPCNRLYAFLGQEIKTALDGDTSASAYAQWIDTYASPEFGSTALRSEQLVDGLAAPFPGEIDADAMERLYRRAMELEVGFFAAQEQPPLSTGGRPVPVPLFRSQLVSNSYFVLMSDFDSTCTVSDSCPVLADLTVSSLRREIEAGGPASFSSVESLRSRWDSLVELYAKEYTQLLDRVLAAKELSSGENGQEKRPYDPETTRQVLEALAELEIAANKRMVDSGVLSGLRAADVKQAGGTIPLREGCGALLKRISEESLPLDFHIVSVCWSRSIIEGSLLDGLGLRFGNIHANELEFSTQALSTGNIVRGLETAVDKEKRFIDILNRTERKLQDRRAFTVYVGDSLTDLLCLLRADIGIVVGESSSLDRVAKAAGITLLPLYSGLLLQKEQLSGKQGAEGCTWTKVEGVLYRISGWHELHAFLLGS